MTWSHSTLFTCFVFKSRICFRSAPIRATLTDHLKAASWPLFGTQSPHCSQQRSYLLPLNTLKQSDEYISGKQFISPQHFFKLRKSGTMLINYPLSLHFPRSSFCRPYNCNVLLWKFLLFTGRKTSNGLEVCHVLKLDIHYTSTIYTHSVHSSQFFLEEINPLGAGNQVPEVCLNSIIQ